MMRRRVTRQVGPGQLEERCRGAQPGPLVRVFLQMNEGAGKLDEPFVKRSIWSVSISQPQLLEHVVGFIEPASIEALEVTEEMRIQIVPATSCDEFGNLRALLAHGPTVVNRARFGKQGHVPSRRFAFTFTLHVDIAAPLLHSPGMAKPALGRGLGALLGGASPTAKPVPVVPTPATSATAPTAPDAPSGERVQRVAIARVRPCPFQPRKDFTPEALQELADSIKEQGIIQPLIVREKDGGFELIAGERRWRAAQLAKVTEVPVVVREADDRTVLELALIENLQRENLNPLEEAQGYAELIATFQMRQEDVAIKVGKSRAVVANSLRLLKLSEELQAYLRDGRLSVGHAKVILALPTPAEQKLAAERIIKQNLNVRQTEELISQLQQRAGNLVANGTRLHGQDTTPVVRDVHVTNLETRLRERFGTKVQLRYRHGKGALDIRFFSDDELERILGIMGVASE